MLYFTRWKTILIWLSVLAGLVFAAPNLFSQSTLGALPDVVVGGNLRVRPTLRNLRRLQHSVAADEAVLRDFYARGVDDGFAWLSEHGEALSDG